MTIESCDTVLVNPVLSRFPNQIQHSSSKSDTIAHLSTELCQRCAIHMYICYSHDPDRFLPGIRVGMVFGNLRSQNIRPGNNADKMNLSILVNI